MCGKESKRSRHMAAHKMETNGKAKPEKWKGNAEKQHMEGIVQNGNANMKMTEQG
jgi:hypothetical protein